MAMVKDELKYSYYAPPSRPEGPRRCPDRVNAGGALVFLMLLWLLYAMGVYTKQKIHLAKLESFFWPSHYYFQIAIRVYSQYCRKHVLLGVYN